MVERRFSIFRRFLLHGFAASLMDGKFLPFGLEFLAAPTREADGAALPNDSLSVRRLGLRPLKRFEFVAKLLARGLAVELPRDLDSIPVHSPIPGLRFLT